MIQHDVSSSPFLPFLCITISLLTEVTLTLVNKHFLSTIYPPNPACLVDGWIPPENKALSCCKMPLYIYYQTTVNSSLTIIFSVSIPCVITTSPTHANVYGAANPPSHTPLLRYDSFLFCHFPSSLKSCKADFICYLLLAEYLSKKLSIPVRGNAAICAGSYGFSWCKNNVSLMLPWVFTTTQPVEHSEWGREGGQK